MNSAKWLACLVIATGCAATTDPAADDSVGEGGGKADGSGSGSGSGSSASPTGTWAREVIDSNATLWNGGPVGWGAGTSIALRADGHPIIAYYDASYHCNNGGFGTYSPDALMVARVQPQGWAKAIEACGPETGYWPRMRVDASDRTHVVFGGGWYTKEQRSYYVRWNAAGTREVSKAVDYGYMSKGAVALMLDDAGAPIIVSNGKQIAEDGTKASLFADETMQTFAERDAVTNTLHVLAITMVPDPGTTGSSTGRMRYARKDGNGTTTIEIPRTVPVATPLGLVLDSDGNPHILSWNVGSTPGNGELWHSTRTSSGWVDELIASDMYTPSAAMAIGADDELIVVAPGRLYRHAASASGWTSSIVTALSSASNPSIVVADDGTLHVAFQVVGSTMSNSVSHAPVYHATFTPN